MKTLLLFVSLFTLISCSTIDKDRYPASFGRDLSGTYLGVADYKLFHKGPNNAATRLYLHPIKGEKESYYALVHEYVNLLNMFPEYVAAAKAPGLNKLIGYLKKITAKLEVMKVVPTGTEGTFNMYEVRVDGESLTHVPTDKPRQLVLSDKQDLEHPLQGAIITSNGSKGQPKEIFFPADRDKKYNGLQYTLANFTYKAFKLDSTWRKSFLPGPYLSAYGRLNDTVLELSLEGGKQMTNFIINPEMKDKSSWRRKKMFTNKKSAFLEGDYEMIEPAEGMFLLREISSNKKTNKVLEGRIGLFVDIFDATKALNQDVVELIFVDPANPKDFLMYYEHPDNGEGTGEVEAEEEKE